ncbi:MAG: Mo-dependent nitrogenase C-terminal domain-containing protein [Pleurocapsa sp.]
MNATHLIKSKIDIFAPLRKWLDNIEVKNSVIAHRICKSIPSQSPFEREVKFLGRIVLRIPPMCKINPLYNEIISLRFRAICYLADVCGEDVSAYC